MRIYCGHKNKTSGAFAPDVFCNVGFSIWLGMMSGSRYDRGRDMLYDSSYLALIYPIGHGALADADDSAVVADVFGKTLGQYSPELFPSSELLSAMLNS